MAIVSLSLGHSTDVVKITNYFSSLLKLLQLVTTAKLKLVLCKQFKRKTLIQ